MGVWRARTLIGRWLWSRHRGASTALVFAVITTLLTVPSAAALSSGLTAGQNWDPPNTPLGAQTKAVKGTALKPDVLKPLVRPPAWTPTAVPAAPVGSADVALGAGSPDAGAARAATGGASPVSGGGALVHAGSLPVSLAPAPEAATSAQAVHVEFADPAKAKAAGISGPVVALTDTGATPNSPAHTVKVALDLKATQASTWSDRAHLVALPACALTTPEQPRCQTRTPVDATLDAASGTLSAEVTLPAASVTRAVTPGSANGPAGTVVQAGFVQAGSGGSAPIVLAAMQGPAGAGGSFTATPLSPSMAWGAGSNMGNFTYSYPIQLPPGLGGQAPNVSLSYDSSMVDGKTSAQNSQSSWIGDGWGYEPGFIERSYKSCAKDGITNSGDLCWGGQNASLSLGGHSGALVRADDTGQWHLQGDDGSKIEQLTGAPNGVNNGEYWHVTTGDGTQYYFGQNHLPGGDGTDPASNSVFSEPVYSPNPEVKGGTNPTPADPCYNASTGQASWCTMGWRWNLDYVVDTHQNLITYTYGTESNSYNRGGGQNNGNGTLTSYTRGGYLKQINYGRRLPEQVAAKGALNPAAQVVFTTSERCLPSGAITCTDAQRTTANASFWPDVPLDQTCDGTSTCTSYGPTFFSTKRLTSINTAVFVNAAPVTVDTWTLDQMFTKPGDGTNPSLWLNSIQRTGSNGQPAVTLPKVSFGAIPLANRIDGLSQPVFNRSRINQITTETGGQINVKYSTPECSRTGNHMPASEDGNTMACMPVKWYLPGSSSPDPVNDWFNKYLVTEVTEQDAVTGASLLKTTDYDYGTGGAAWHRNDAEFTDPKTRTWDGFRGYQSVTTTTGSAYAGEAPKTQKTVRYLRGMDGDYKADGTQRAVTVTSPLGPTVTDSDWLAGGVLASQTYSQAGGSVVAMNGSTTGGQQATATHVQSGGMPPLVARYPASQVTTLSKQLQADGTSWRTTTAVSTSDPAHGNRPLTLDDQGDGSAAIPEICTTNSYASSGNPQLTAVLTALLNEKKTIRGPCGTTATAANTISDQRTLFDGQTFGQAGDIGDPSSTQVLDHYDTGGSPVYVNAGSSTFDSYGRPTVLGTTDGSTYAASGAQLTGPAVASAITKTDYTPATGSVPTTVTATGPTGWVSTGTQDPGRGVPLTSSDPNSRVTTEQYDALGRLTAVWNPDRATNLSASVAYAYAVNGVTAPSVVTTTTLRETLPGSTDFSSKTELYDGLGRLRQTQTTPPNGGSGRLVSDTAYDSHGWAVKSSSPYYDDVTNPNGTVFTAQDSQIPAQTWTTYDGLGRVTNSAFMSYAQPQWATATAYPGVDRTDVNPPRGGTPVSTVTDARGHTTAQWQYRTAAATGNAADADVTTYTYTPAGQPATRADSVGNTWTYAYDLRGRQTSATDPDTGTTQTFYDANSHVDHTTDAKGNTLAYTYDLLGRKTATYSGAVAPANQLTGWTYDTLAKGQPTSSTRYVGGASGLAYTQAITGYDTAYRSLGSSTTIPAAPGEGALAGTYKTSNTYNPVLGTLAKTTLPAMGGLPAETLNYEYYATGVLLDYSGNSALVPRVIYDAYARPVRTDVGQLGTQVVSTQQYDAATGRTVSSWIDRQTGTASADQTSYTYNPAGQITSVTDKQDGTATDTQCYTYDYLGRLTQAWSDSGSTGTLPTGYWSDTSGAGQGSGKTGSVPGIGGCTNANGPAVDPATGVTSVGGPAPYWQSYAYDATGNRTSITSRTTAPAPAAPNSFDPSQITQLTAAGDSTQTWGVALSGGKAWVAQQNSDGSWGTFTDIASLAGWIGTVDSVSAAWSNGQLQVMTTYGGKIWHTLRRSDGTWQSWGDVMSVVGTLAQPSQPVVTNTASGLEVLTFAGGKIWHTLRRPDGTWSGWGDVLQAVGPLSGATQIAATSTASGLETVVTAGGKLWHTLRRADGTWSGWGDVYSQTGTLGSTLTGPGQLSTTGTSAGLQVIALAGGKPWHSLRKADGTWSAWADVTSAAGPVVSPAFVAGAASGADLKILLAGSGQFNYSKRDGTTQAWTPWAQIKRASAGTVVSATSVTTSSYPTAKSTNIATGAPNTGGGTGGPHALLSTTTTSPTGTTASSYQYDQLGNTTAVTDTSGTTSLSWDTEDKLSSVTKTGQTSGTSYLYDADGNQLIRRDPGKVTLNLGIDELTLDTASGSMSDVRYYGSPGGITITRVTSATGGGTIVYQAADPHGTNGIQIGTDAAQTETRRPTDPFGNPRGTQPTPATWSGDKGFVGGTKDDATGLTNLGAREYDPAHGRFLNPDPILDAASPQQWNGYAYSNNNPVNLSDPSGLHPPGVCGGLGTCEDRQTNVIHESWTSNDNGHWNLAYWDNVLTTPQHPDHAGANWSLVYPGGTGRERLEAGLDFLTAVPSPLAIPAAVASSVLHAQDGKYLDAAGDLLKAIPVAGRLKEVDQAAKAGDTLMQQCKISLQLDLMNSDMHSFPGETKVLLADGSSSPIEDLKVGDTVEATDPLTEKSAPKHVVAKIATPDDRDFTDLTIAPPASTPSTKPEGLTSTQHHPFWDATSHRWTDAADLLPGDQVGLPDGRTVTVQSVRNYQTSPRIAYDLTVADVHTYYVLAGETPVLVHNSDPGPDPSSFSNLIPVDTPDWFKPIAPGTALSRSGNYAYVVTEGGELVIGKRTAGHVSLAQGGDVLAAGEFKTKGGQVVYLDNKSGHYQPYGANAEKAAVDAFNRNGLAADGKYIEAWRPSC